jgi:hypothetical protein
MSKEAMKLALEEYMSAFGQALEAHGIPLQEQQIKADRQAREALAKQEQGEPDYKVTVIDNQHPNGIPLEQWGYTTPQQRTWVGLTDEERMELYPKFTDSDEWTYEKAIEAKLKEKNNG